ncbi:MAG: DUF6599 family protein [Opitutales bacterium]
MSAKSRKFHRTDIGSKEKTVGGFIIMLLVAIGVTIGIKGKRYDPSRFTGDASALEFTREAVTGIAATLRDEVDLRASEQVRLAGEATDSPQGDELPAFVNGLSPMGPTERYTADSLYEKINGRAPAYLEYNFQELTSRSYLLMAAPGEFIDVFLFRMDSPLNAFGIFSAERDDSGQPLEFAPDGYGSEMGFFLRKGDIYVQTLASSTSPLVMKLAREFTMRLTESLPADDSGMEGREFLPAQGQIPGSLTYINDNAYGQNALTAVFEARYQVGDEVLTYFVKSCADAAEAATAWASVKSFYERYGSGQESFDTAGSSGFVANMFGQWAAIFTKDAMVAGVINAGNRDSAIGFVESQLATGANQEEFEDYNF